jgi:hypothetical protein
MKSLRVLLCSVLAVGLAAPVYVAHAQSRSEETASTATNFTGTAPLPIPASGTRPKSCEIGAAARPQLLYGVPPAARLPPTPMFRPQR